jgi:hypothetical protein
MTFGTARLHSAPRSRNAPSGDVPRGAGDWPHASIVPLIRGQGSPSAQATAAQGDRQSASHGNVLSTAGRGHERTSVLGSNSDVGLEPGGRPSAATPNSGRSERPRRDGMRTKVRYQCEPMRGIRG